MREKILIISFSALRSDPRVHRQITALAPAYEVYTLGLSAPAVVGVTHFPVQARPCTSAELAHKAGLLLARRFETYYWRWPGKARQVASIDMQAIVRHDFDLIIANDIDALPLGLKLARGRPVLFDAHEFAPREFEDLFTWRLFFMAYKQYLCRTYLRQASAMMTVCDGIAREYERLYGVHPVVITNAAPFADLVLSEVRGDRIRIVHHGGAIAGRKLESMIAMMAHLDKRYSLHLMLVPTRPAYVARLRRLARGDERIFFPPPVPMPQIASALNEFDIGVYMLEPRSFNNKHALPNKFFEFVQGRLAVAIGPSPEMAALVRAHDLGIVTESFEPAEMARRISALTPADIRRYKQNAHVCARELSAESNREKLLALVRDTIARTSAPCAA
jgi:hypothetical protein